MEKLIKSVLAGMMIGIGGIAYLTVGGLAGAVLFSVGLFTILVFKFNLFTGKAHLVLDGEMSINELMLVWLGNLMGTALVALIGIVAALPALAGATAIVEATIGLSPLNALARGVLCGLLMNVAVVGSKHKRFGWILVVLCVAAFIMCGFLHSIAFMFYWIAGATSWSLIWQGAIYLLAITVGNFIGCNIKNIGDLIVRALAF